MSCDDILLHIQTYPDATPRPAIDAALALAKRLSGRISALAVEISVAYMPNLVLDHLLGIQDLAKEAEARSAAASRDAIGYFRTEAAALGILHDTEVVAADMGVEGFKRALAARAFDFSIYCPPPENVDKVLAETLLLLSGRPLLMLPEGHKGVLRRAVVAWDGSPAAARAMNDAMPLLQAASSVQVVSVSDDKPVDRAAPQALAVRHLIRHGVQAEGVQIDSDRMSTAQALELHLTAAQADIIVMGAFGHSRLREIVLGGVTDHMLSETPAAVWLSH